jgi:aryl-alcohol dehydrogenase-like predicted oxidoreductase
MYKKIILGTAQFGMKYGISNTDGEIKLVEVFKILNFLKQKKITSLDTARSYKSSERKIGKYFKKTKKKFNIITKFSFKNNNSVESQFKESFKALGYIPNTILAHSYKDYMNPKFHKQINILKEKYSINNIGVSLYNISELNKILTYKRPDLVQVPINILDKRFLDPKICKILKKKSIKILGRSIFLQGLFFNSQKFIFKNFKGAKNKYLEILKIANYEKMTLAELSLNWAFHLKEVDNIVLGIDNLSHLKKNLDIVKKRISKESLEQIKKINLNNNNIIRPYLWKIKQ